MVEDETVLAIGTAGYPECPSLVAGVAWIDNAT